MLKQWNKLLNTDCVVLKVANHNVYPIFRVGSTSLESACDHRYVNEEIQACSNIEVMIREPEERFRSGVNEYCFQHKRNVLETYSLIEHGKLYDRHFTPQYMWLLHLYKYYKGFITLRPFSHITNYTNIHKAKSMSDVAIPVCEPFVAVDRYLTKYHNQTVNIGYLIKRYRNVLS
jgi:hypothetical protein